MCARGIAPGTAVVGKACTAGEVVPHAFGERAVMKLMFAALLRASETCRGIRISEFELRHLALLRNELNEQFTAGHASSAQLANLASRSRISSKRGT